MNRSWRRKLRTMKRRRSSPTTRTCSRQSKRTTITMNLLLRRNSGILMERWTKRRLRTHWNSWSLNTLEDSQKSTQKALRSSCKRRRIIRINSLKTKSVIRRLLRTTRRSIRRNLPKSKRNTSGITRRRRRRNTPKIVLPSMRFSIRR